MKAVPSTPRVRSLIPVCDKMYLIQLHVVKFVSDLRQAGHFLQVLWVSSTNIIDHYKDTTNILLKVVLNE